MVASTQPSALARIGISSALLLTCAALLTAPCKVKIKRKIHIVASLSVTASLVLYAQEMIYITWRGCVATRMRGSLQIMSSFLSCSHRYIVQISVIGVLIVSTLAFIAYLLAEGLSQSVARCRPSYGPAAARQALRRKLVYAIPVLIFTCAWAALVAALLASDRIIYSALHVMFLGIIGAHITAVSVAMFWRLRRVVRVAAADFRSTTEMFQKRARELEALDARLSWLVRAYAFGGSITSSISLAVGISELAAPAYSTYSESYAKGYREKWTVSDVVLYAPPFFCAIMLYYAWIPLNKSRLCSCFALIQRGRKGYAPSPVQKGARGTRTTAQSGDSFHSQREDTLPGSVAGGQISCGDTKVQLPCDQCNGGSSATQAGSSSQFGKDLIVRSC